MKNMGDIFLPKYEFSSLKKKSIQHLSVKCISQSKIKFVRKKPSKSQCVMQRFFGGVSIVFFTVTCMYFLLFKKN